MTRKPAPCASSPLAMAHSTGVGSSPVPSIMAAIREGIFGLLSTSTCRWSLSSCAGVRATSRCRKSTVASGPMPPMTPTIFSDIAGQAEDIRIAAQRDRPAGMQEDDIAVLGEEAALDLIDHPVHAFAAIDRIEEDAFGARQQLHRLDHARRRKAVAGPDIIGIGHDMRAFDDAGCAQMFGGTAGQVE